MKRNEIQSQVETFLTSTTEQLTVQEIVTSMRLPFTTVSVRYHLDSLVMKGKIKSITTSRPMPDGRNHRVVVYYK